MTQHMTRILIVEDNADLAYGLRTGLEIEGYQVDVATDGTSGLARARETNPHLVILDLMLPGMDGYRVLRSLRDSGHDMPVLILTARGEEADKVLGFRIGADDYVVKPCGVLELLGQRLFVGDGLGRLGSKRRFGILELRPGGRDARVGACWRRKAVSRQWHRQRQEATIWLMPI